MSQKNKIPPVIITPDTGSAPYTIKLNKDNASQEESYDEDHDSALKAGIEASIEEANTRQHYRLIAHVPSYKMKWEMYVDNEEKEDEEKASELSLLPHVKKSPYMSQNLGGTYEGSSDEQEELQEELDETKSKIEAYTKELETFFGKCDTFLLQDLARQEPPHKELILSFENPTNSFYVQAIQERLAQLSTTPYCIGKELDLLTTYLTLLELTEAKKELLNEDTRSQLVETLI